MLRKTGLPILVLIVLSSIPIAIMVFRGDHKKPSPTHTQANTNNIQDLKLFELDGKQSPIEDPKAKLSIINFWASWCQPCLIEMPSLQKLLQTYEPQGLRLILINVDEDPKIAIPKTMNRLELSLHSYFDYNQIWSSFFEVNALPHTILLDKNLIKIEEILGDQNWISRSWKNKIQNYLSQ